MTFYTFGITGRNVKRRRAPGIRNFVRFLMRSDFTSAWIGARFSTHSGDILSNVDILPTHVRDEAPDIIVKSIIDRLVTEAASILVSQKYPT